MPPSLRVAALVAAGIGLALPSVAQAASGNCYSRLGCAQQARSSSAFMASVGVNTHLGYSNTVYWQNWPMIRARLVELGVSHVRDGTYPVSYPDVIGPTIVARYNALKRRGINGNLLVGHEQAMTPTSLRRRLAWIKKNVASFTTSIEGSNEFDTGGDPARIQSLRTMQCDIYRRVKRDPVLSSKPVIGPSAGPAFSDGTWYSQVGDLSGCLDKGNLHPYPGSDPPHRRLSRDLSIAMGLARATYGTKPQWVTETGHWNTADPGGVSEAAAGTYIPRALLENARRGIERTQVYELIDFNSRSGRVIDNYGLLRTDGSRKPAFTAVRNMLRIMKGSLPRSASAARSRRRRAGRSSTRKLRFGIVCTKNCRSSAPDVYPTQDGPIRHVLLRQPSGAFILAVWSESKVWDSTTRTDTPKAAQSFKLYLRRAPAKVEIYSPATARSAVDRDKSPGRMIRAIATDQVRLIKITPRTP